MGKFLDWAVFLCSLFLMGIAMRDCAHGQPFTPPVVY